MGKIFLILIVLAGAVYAYMQFSNDKSKEVYADGFVRLAGMDVQVDVVDTEADRTLGLGFRDKLTDNQGMLFVFPAPNDNSFWMKNMQFGIDIIWIRNNKVVDITKSAMPQPGVADGDLLRYRPSEYVDQVLELSAGWSDQFGLKIGDTVEFTPAHR